MSYEFKYDMFNVTKAYWDTIDHRDRLEEIARKNLANNKYATEGMADIDRFRYECIKNLQYLDELGDYDPYFGSWEWEDTYEDILRYHRWIKEEEEKLKVD